MRVRLGGEIITGGDPQGAVEPLGSARSLGANVARNLNGHVDERVVHGRTATGQVRPHLATKVCLVLNDATIGANPRVSVRCFGHDAIPLSDRL